MNAYQKIKVCSTLEMIGRNQGVQSMANEIMDAPFLQQHLPLVQWHPECIPAEDWVLQQGDNHRVKQNRPQLGSPDLFLLLQVVAIAHGLDNRRHARYCEDEARDAESPAAIASEIECSGEGILVEPPKLIRTGREVRRELGI